MELTAYIINLKHRTDRYKHVTEEIKKLPLTSFRVVEGIVDNTKTCFQSHRECIRLAKNSKLPYVLILEDDVIFTDGITDALQATFREVQTLDWHMYYLGANLEGPVHRVSSGLLKLTAAFAAHAYIVHERFYDVILELPHTCEMDIHYSNLMNRYNMYLCNPIVAYQLPTYSDLQKGFRDYNDAIDRNFKRYAR